MSRPVFLAISVGSPAVPRRHDYQALRDPAPREREERRSSTCRPQISPPLLTMRDGPLGLWDDDVKRGEARRCDTTPGAGKPEQVASTNGRAPSGPQEGMNGPAMCQVQVYVGRPGRHRAAGLGAPPPRVGDEQRLQRDSIPVFWHNPCWTTHRQTGEPHANSALASIHINRYAGMNEVPSFWPLQACVLLQRG